MKRLVALLLACLTVFGCGAALADLTYFEPELTIEIMDQAAEQLGSDADQWFSTPNNRAFMTMLLMTDYARFSGEPADLFLLDNSYLGYHEGTFSVLLNLSAGGCFTIHFKPGATQAGAGRYEFTSEQLIASGDVDEYNFTANDKAEFDTLRDPFCDRYGYQW